MLTCRNSCAIIFDNIFPKGLLMMERFKEKTATNKIAKRKTGKIRAKSDFFRTARYGLTLQEHRIIYGAILAGQQDKKPFEPVTITVKDFKELFDLKGESAYKELRKASKKLIGKSLEVIERDKNGKAKSYAQRVWLKSVVYNVKEGTVTISPNEELKPYFEGKPFSETQYQFLIHFSSQYAERLYELLVGHDIDNRTSFDFTPEQLAELLKVPKSYKKNYTDFKKRVLAPAIDDINEHTDINVSIKEKHGRYNKVETVFFTVRKKKSPSLKERPPVEEYEPPLTDEEQEKFLLELLGENQMPGQMTMLDEAEFTSKAETVSTTV